MNSKNITNQFETKSKEFTTLKETTAFLEEKSQSQEIEVLNICLQ